MKKRPEATQTCALAVVRRTYKQTNKQTNKQGRLQYTAQLSAQCKMVVFCTIMAENRVLITRIWSLAMNWNWVLVGLPGFEYKYLLT